MFLAFDVFDVLFQIVVLIFTTVKKAKALRLQLSTCFYYLAPFCIKVKGDDGIYPNPPSLIPFTTQKYV